MRVEHILEKGSGQINEDTLILENNIFGVFDGASSLDSRLFENRKTGGFLAATIAGQIFSRNHYPLHRLGCDANTAILSKMNTLKVDLSRRHTLWSTSAAVVRVTEQHLEWFQTGDADIIVINKDGSFVAPVQREDQDYETLMLLKNNPSKTASRYKTQVKKTREKMNQTYGVLNGEPSAEKFFNTGQLSLDNIRSVLIFTDGLQLATVSPKRRKNYKPFISLYRKLGLKGLKNLIRKIEAKDPDVTRLPRFKRHDDIAAIALHF